MNLLRKLSLFLLVATTQGFSEICSFTCLSDKPLQIYVGPEIYHVHRKREGGAKQDGVVYGIKGGYERIKRYKIYFGFDALYSKGVLHGKGGAGNHLKSNFGDTYVEGRLGYTFQSKCRFKPLFTPFAGVGYFIEKNNFTHPKSTPIHFKTTYVYATAGFLSRVSLTEKFDLGLNFKIKYPYEAKCRVSNDPRQIDSTQVINEKIQYRVELPLTYNNVRDISCLSISFVPFYELRQYGYHPNYPSDFLETRLDIYGGLIKLIYNL